MDHPARARRALPSSLVLLALLAGPGAPGAHAQEATGAGGQAQPAEDPYAGRPIGQIVLRRPGSGPGEFEPLDPATEQLVMNQLRSRVGTEYRPDLVQGDLRYLNMLGRFAVIEPRVVLRADGGVNLIILLTEQPVIEEVQPVGNRRIGDQEIRAVVSDLIGGPVDPQIIDRRARQIENMYRRKGYYRALVTPDLDELAETGILYLRVREGVRLRITEIRFRGVDGELVFSPRELRREVKTETVGLFGKGELDENRLDDDVQRLIRHYMGRGYLDVRVDRLVVEAPTGREAIVEFLVSPGPRYTMRSVRAYYPQRVARRYPSIEEATASLGPGEQVHVRDIGDVEVYTMGVYTSEQISGLIGIKPGDVYSSERMGRVRSIVQNAYGSMGYSSLDPFTGETVGGVTLREHQLRDEREPLVDLVLEINEDQRVRTGEIPIQGNELTRHNVIRRNIGLKPGRWLDWTEVDRSAARLRRSGLFALPGPQTRGPRLTVQPEDPEYPGYRDVLVQVEETNTGEFNIGAQANSDFGVAAYVTVIQRNFDVRDPPDSFMELITGRAFRGGGQTLTLNLSPGNRFQTYSLSLTEPAIFDSDYSVTGTGLYRYSNYRQFDEERFGGRVGVGRVFGSRWRVNSTLRNEWVALDDLDPESPIEFYRVADRSRLTGLELAMWRTSVPETERFIPTRGNRVELAAEQVGVLGGDFTFTKLRGEFATYLPIIDTFDFHTTVLSFSTRVNYIPQDEDKVPPYERYYLGGQNFRGFSTRTISPRGTRADTGGPSPEAVGGTWSFFLGTELRQPIYEDIVSVVGFVDTGTVLFEPGFDDYRLSVGFGLRVKVPALSEIPLAFDFGFPILREENDRKRLFTFSLDVPFGR